MPQKPLLLLTFGGNFSNFYRLRSRDGGDEARSRCPAFHGLE